MTALRSSLRPVEGGRGCDTGARISVALEGQGRAARPGDRPAVLSSLAGLPWADLDRRGWQSVGLVAAELRDRGERLPLTDIEIAVAASLASAAVWTTDRDFERIADVLEGLQLQLESGR